MAYTNAMGSQGYSADATLASPKETPLNRLLSALSSLEMATGAVVQTTDALCGSQPQVGEKANSQDPSPAGMFAAISVSANRVERMASTISECMSRIQRVAE